MGAALPDAVADVLSIPSALAALRTSLAPGRVEPWRARARDRRAHVRGGVRDVPRSARRDPRRQPRGRHVIVLDGLSRARGPSARRPASRLENVTLTWERASSPSSARPADGTTALLEVLAGVLPVRAGTATVDGRAPDEARAHVAYVPLDPALPDALRVERGLRARGAAPRRARDDGRGDALRRSASRSSPIDACARSRRARRAPCRSRSR